MEENQSNEKRQFSQTEQEDEPMAIDESNNDQQSPQNDTEFRANQQNDDVQMEDVEMQQNLTYEQNVQNYHYDNEYLAKNQIREEEINGIQSLSQNCTIIQEQQNNHQHSLNELSEQETNQTTLQQNNHLNQQAVIQQQIAEQNVNVNENSGIINELNENQPLTEESSNKVQEQHIEQITEENQQIQSYPVNNNDTDQQTSYGGQDDQNSEKCNDKELQNTYFNREESQTMQEQNENAGEITTQAVFYQLNQLQQNNGDHNEDEVNEEDTLELMRQVDNNQQNQQVLQDFNISFENPANISNNQQMNEREVEQEEFKQANIQSNQQLQTQTSNHSSDNKSAYKGGVNQDNTVWSGAESFFNNNSNKKGEKKSKNQSIPQMKGQQNQSNPQSFQQVEEEKKMGPSVNKINEKVTLKDQQQVEIKEEKDQNKYYKIFQNEQGNLIVRLYNYLEVELAEGDLTQQLDVDAIANAANRELQHAGGLATAIVRRFGRQIQVDSDNWINRFGKLDFGLTAYTTAGNFKQPKYIIHSCGPIWYNGQSNEPQKLRQCVYNTLIRAEELKCKSIAIPAFSTGIYNFPKDLCAQITLQTLDDYARDNFEEPDQLLKFVRIVNFEQATAEEFYNDFLRRYSVFN